MKNPLTKEAFADWCEQQGSRKYNYLDYGQCACAQYARFLGVVWQDSEGEMLPGYWSEMDAYACENLTRTFAALAQRLRESA